MLNEALVVQVHWLEALLDYLHFIYPFNCTDMGSYCVDVTYTDWYIYVLQNKPNALWFYCDTWWVFVLLIMGACVQLFLKDPVNGTV